MMDWFFRQTSCGSTYWQIILAILVGLPFMYAALHLWAGVIEEKYGKEKVMPKQMYCNPDVCPNCMYIGEGDSWCDVTQEIVLSDWVPTDNYMAKGCPHAGAQKPKRKKKRKKNAANGAGTPKAAG